MGPALVEHLEGSASAKERLELILQTIAGQVSVVQACQLLKVSEARFYKLRNRVLQVCLEDLEPKPLGRPVRLVTEHEKHSAELAAEIARLEQDLAAQSVRLELTETLPQLRRTASEPEKKARRQPPRKRHQRPH